MRTPIDSSTLHGHLAKTITCRLQIMADGRALRDRLADQLRAELREAGSSAILTDTNLDEKVPADLLHAQSRQRRGMEAWLRAEG
jgi:hypothetical protein